MNRPHPSLTQVVLNSKVHNIVTLLNPSEYHRIPPGVEDCASWWHFEHAAFEDGQEVQQALSAKALGQLRDELSKSVRARVSAELAKDLTHLPAQELQEHLGTVIAV